MKKALNLLSVALALVSCVKTQDVFSPSPEARQIAFSPLAQPATKTVTQSAVFNTAYTMEIAAYQSAPATAANYFTKMTFKKDATEAYWRGWDGSAYAPVYWPLSPATLNFFAISANGVTNSHVTIANDLATAGVAYTSENLYDGTTTQSDIMYAFNRGSVTQSGNTLSFNSGTPVSMQFKHALALVNFQIKASDAASCTIAIKKIELNGARYTGTLLITNTNASTVSDSWSAQLDWTPDNAVDAVKVPNIGNTSSPVSLTTSYVPENTTTSESEGNAWAALMIIPKQQKAASPVSYGFTTFTIYYTINGKEYTITYAPGGYTDSTPNLTEVEAGKKYTYQISMQLHEITVSPSVTQWDDQTPVAVSIP